MAKLTDHAKKRAIERFNFSKSDFSNLGVLFNDYNRYSFIKNYEGGEIRQITYKGLDIQCVVRNDKITSIIPPTFVFDDNDKDSMIAVLQQEIKCLNSKYKRLKHRYDLSIESLCIIQSMSLFKFLQFFFCMRMQNNKKER